MATQIKIDLKTDYNGGWYFQITAPEFTHKDEWGHYILSGEIITGPQFWTPDTGGLWSGGRYGQQELGTCQFGLPNYRKGAYNTIRNMVLRGQLHTMKV